MESRKHNAISIVFTSSSISFCLIIGCATFAQLIFSKTSENIPLGFSLILLGTVFFTLITALFSRMPFAIAHPQDESFPILALMVAQIYSSGLNSHEALSTALISIAISTFLTGLLLFLVGFFKLGKLVDRIPKAVVSGFLVSLGLILTLGSLKESFYWDGSVSNLYPHLFEPVYFLHWIIPVLFCLVLIFVRERIKSPLVIPGVLLGSLILFYLGVAASKMPFESLHQHKLLFQAVATSNPFKDISEISFQNISLQVLISQLGNIICVPIISLITILLISKNLENHFEIRADHNYELKLAGISNLIGSLFLCPAGYLSYTYTMLNKELKNSSVLIGVLTSLICLIVLLLFANVVSYFPSGVLNGVILYLGVSIVRRWLSMSLASKQSKLDHLTLLCVVACSLYYGLAFGFFAGIFIYGLERAYRLSVKKEV